MDEAGKPVAILRTVRRAAETARELALAPRPPTLLLTVVGLALADWGSELTGDSVLPGGPLDELAHLLTMVLVLWALGRRVTERFLVPALIASVAIDLDHVPQHLGTNFLTAGTPRPYTHSLLTLVVVLVLAALWRTAGGRRVLVGVALGLAVHFWRDLGESGTGVALLWPLTKASASLPHWSYLVVMVGIAAAVVARMRTARLGVDIRPRRPPCPAVSERGLR